MAGSIKKLDKNKYKVTLYMGRINGKRKDVRKVIDGPKKIAEQFLNEKIREKHLGEYSEPSKMLLADHMNGLIKRSKQELRQKHIKTIWIW